MANETRLIKGGGFWQQSWKKLFSGWPLTLPEPEVERSGLASSIAFGDPDATQTPLYLGARGQGVAWAGVRSPSQVNLGTRQVF